MNLKLTLATFFLVWQLFSLFAVFSPPPSKDLRLFPVHSRSLDSSNSFSRRRCQNERQASTCCTCHMRKAPPNMKTVLRHSKTVAVESTRTAGDLDRASFVTHCSPESKYSGHTYMHMSWPEK
uniref:HDC10955 n=1 Tax=Drosophila melanogaster TaxID=7227 RepID=Q6IKZ5_DROME|nr:TPA_inf: HDC10955 [Drosophila melanogaster]